MPIIKTLVSACLRTFVSEFSDDIFSSDGTVLYCKIFVEQLFHLLFLSNDWIFDHENEDKNCHEHFELLRIICIPKILNIAHCAERYTECIKLAGYITDKTNKFYQLFSQADLKKLLAKISESSVCIMESHDQQLDAWRLKK